ncbi:MULTISPECIES: BlaI/MecI/CopY family transcriptional regulator [Paenibacillus]|uniref:BlaI/MecI/CopY family transcriptional regulator n=1 Tax=Paenibacillus TaxID=44249 RepID=UPI00096E797B|nr:BlaI/MecI/CopY family transcriptional regulator [Paenibacillus peoriae]OMF70357.1 BlaI family transcriptional regulator [Paenibacillus peoriae]OMF81286.1 BlaI family transcriptional regulator [Paenibacillus peoriae]
MDKLNLVDSELKVMSVLWQEGDTAAKHIAAALSDKYGWNVNTTYTLIKRCIKKGAIERSEPNFMCHALVSQEEVQKKGMLELVNKIFNGSSNKLFASLLGKKELSDAQIERLKKMVDELDE